MSKVASALESIMPQTTLTGESAPSDTIKTATGQSNLNHSRSNLLPEFSLKDKVIVVSGGARGLGLVQIEACLEAGATGNPNTHAGVVIVTKMCE
jgi:hypothetical protein